MTFLPDAAIVRKGNHFGTAIVKVRPVSDKGVIRQCRFMPAASARSRVCHSRFVGKQWATREDVFRRRPSQAVLPSGFVQVNVGVSYVCKRMAATAEFALFLGQSARRTPATTPGTLPRAVLRFMSQTLSSPAVHR